MDKIAIVVQQIGKDVNGGAEAHARALSKHLQPLYDITVLTSCSKDGDPWTDHYQEGEDDLEGIKIIRFKSTPRINKEKFYKRILKAKVRYEKEKSNPLKRIYYKIKQYPHFSKANLFGLWSNCCGPHVPDLVDYISGNKDNYKAFIFFSYLFYPTTKGMKEVADKSIFIPLAHDEIMLYFEGFEEIFSSPRFIMYNSPSEQHLVEKTYPAAKNIKSDIAGVGIDIPSVPENCSEVNTDFKYFVYVGRIARGKGCKMLIDYFINYVKTYNSNVKLIMIGQNFMGDIPQSDHIIFTGFVSDKLKNYYIEHSLGLIIPSFYESLSLVTLEAMAMGKPVLANESCKVLKDHITASGSGYVFENQESFDHHLNKIQELTGKEVEKIGNKGKNYVSRNYNWSTIVSQFEEAINYISKNVDKPS